jgi:hypothetical protein
MFKIFTSDKPLKNFSLDCNYHGISYYTVDIISKIIDFVEK